MRMLTEAEIEQLRADERRAVVRQAIDILRRRAEACSTFSGERDLLRAAGEIALLTDEVAA